MIQQSADVWITRDRREIPIREMTDDHLNSTIRFLARRADAMRIEILRRMGRYIADAPDGAATACSAEADAIIEMSDAEFLAAYVPQWTALLKERARRGQEREARA